MVYLLSTGLLESSHSSIGGLDDFAQHVGAGDDPDRHHVVIHDVHTVDSLVCHLSHGLQADRRDRERGREGMIFRSWL